MNAPETARDPETSGRPAPSKAGAQRGAGAALSLGTTMAAGMILFAALGWWLDRKRGTGVFWTVCGLLLGFATGLYEAWKAIRQIEPPARRPRDDAGGAGR